MTARDRCTCAGPNRVVVDNMGALRRDGVVDYVLGVGLLPPVDDVFGILEPARRWLADN